MSTCQHRDTTFSRDICPDPCGVMHTSCDDCGEMVDACVHVDPANWTREQAQAAQAELDELERTDPDVAAAATSYDRMVERVTGRRSRIACGLWEGCRNDDGLHDARCPASGQTATPAERAAANELTRELDSVYAEPTDADLAAAATALDWHRGLSSYRALDSEPRRDIERVARALAAERAAIHARYEAVAAECDEDAVTPDPSESLTWAAAAARIRQVAAQ